MSDTYEYRLNLKFDAYLVPMHTNIPDHNFERSYICSQTFKYKTIIKREILGRINPMRIPPQKLI